MWPRQSPTASPVALSYTRRPLWRPVLSALASHSRVAQSAGGDAGALRFLNLHEYQSKDLMETHGVLVQKGRMAATAKEAGDVARWILKANPKAELIVKALVRGIADAAGGGRAQCCAHDAPPHSATATRRAPLSQPRTQIHAGGRGKGVFTSGFKGGVKICTTAEEVEAMAGKMLGGHLVTKQTGPAGQLVSKVLVNEGIKVRRRHGVGGAAPGCGICARAAAAARVAVGAYAAASHRARTLPAPRRRSTASCTLRS